MEPAPIKATVTFELFQQLDIRVGRILSVEGVSASRKLARLRVSFGDHERTILAGLKGERRDLATLIGVQTLFVVNVAPRVMAGEVSEGTLFDIGYADGLVPVLAVPESSVPDGARLG